jgi:hypothetical protein
MPTHYEATVTEFVRRVSRHNVNKPAVYIRGDKPEPFTKTMPKLIAEVVTKPMRTAEVVQAVIESGWQTTMKPEHLRTHVKASLRRAGFREKDGKWARS